jgi:hypothetical protein
MGLVASFFMHGYIFHQTVFELKQSLELLNVGPLSTAELLGLYYVSKVGLIAIFIFPLGWIVGHMKKLQSLRTVHADKAAQANTLQLMLNSGFDIDNDSLCESAVKEIFSSSLEQTKKTAKSKGIDENVLCTLLLKLLPKAQEEKE